MSNEQALREALRETLLFCETFSNRWDGETGAHPFGMVERARQALALPTAEQVDDINVAESFTSVTKPAAPVGERELPPVIAYRLDYPASEGVGLPRFFGADDGERAHTFAFNHKATITELCDRATAAMRKGQG